MAIVETNALTKNFGSYKAVNNLNLTLKEGTLTGFIGPNGAGKTTTIKMILGLLKPSSGEIKVFGQNPWDNIKIKPLVGVVYDKAFFPEGKMTREYLEFACRMFDLPESKALEVLKYVDLQDAQEKPIKALSAGMLQKFSIAHALLNEPKLIIADEMTANLDPQARSSLIDLVLRIHQENNTTFFISSHILPELGRVCDSIVVIDQGKVVTQGKLEDVLNEQNMISVRVNTDKPQELAQIIKNLPYVLSVENDPRRVLVNIERKGENQVYEDIISSSKKVNAKILGIETSSASIEMLYETSIGKKSKS